MFIVFSALIFALTVFSACESVSQIIVTKDFFNFDNEIIKYKIINPGDPENNFPVFNNSSGIIFNLDCENSGYTTAFTKKDDRFELETTLNILGSYEINGEITEVNDEIKTKSAFYSSGSIKLFSSEREGKTHSFSPSGKLEFYEFNYNLNYEGSKANGRLYVKNGDVIKDKALPSFKTSSDFFDNEMMFFGIRAIYELNKTSNASFKIIDVLAENISALSLSAATEKNIDISITRNGNNEDITLGVLDLRLKINSTYSGSEIKLEFAKDIEIYKRRMISLEQQMPQNLGSLKYVIKSVTES